MKLIYCMFCDFNHFFCCCCSFWFFFLQLISNKPPSCISTEYINFGITQTFVLVLADFEIISYRNEVNGGWARSGALSLNKEICKSRQKRDWMRCQVKQIAQKFSNRTGKTIWNANSDIREYITTSTTTTATSTSTTTMIQNWKKEKKPSNAPQTMVNCVRWSFLWIFRLMLSKKSLVCSFALFRSFD